MNKKLLISVIILIILIITLIIMGIFSFFNKPKIVEIKTFSEIPGFSFEYPVFKGWEVNEIKKNSENEYVMFLNYPDSTDFYVAPQIKIKKIEYYQRKPGMVDEPISFEVKKNPQGISYGKPNDGSLEFYADNFRIRIEPFAYEGNGYSNKIFIQKIIDSFKFEKVFAAIKSDYGKVTQYGLNQEIQFPDFNLKFIGTREIPGPNNAKWYATIYDFIVSDKDGSQTVSWSSGSGDIAPRKFSIGGKDYFLERGSSWNWKLGRLEGNELVVLTNEQFLEIEKQLLEENHINQ